MRASQQVELVGILNGAAGWPARSSATGAPTQCDLDFFLEAFAAEREVAVGGVAYLADDFFIYRAKEKAGHKPRPFPA